MIFSLTTQNTLRFTDLLLHTVQTNHNCKIVWSTYVHGCMWVVPILLQAAIGSFALDIALDRNIGEDVESLGRKVSIYDLDLDTLIIEFHSRGASTVHYPQCTVEESPKVLMVGQKY